MKLKLFGVVAALMAAPSAMAFSLDFTGIGLGTVADETTPIVITVPGYGDVSFSTLPGQDAMVGTTYVNQTLEFSAGETVIIDFLNGPVENVSLAFDGIDGAEAPAYTIINSVQGQADLPTGNGVGINSMTFDQSKKIPEPSVLLLIGIGTLTALRRKR